MESFIITTIYEMSINIDMLKNKKNYKKCVLISNK